MGKQTTIQWTDASHNFWYGCKKVSGGCANCYAEREMKRFGKDFSSVVKAKGFNKPLSWKEPMKVFVNSWSDFFIEESDGWRDEAMDIIVNTPHLIWLILTKRPERALEWFNSNVTTLSFLENVWLGVTAEDQKTADERIPVLLRIPAAKRFVSCEPMLSAIDFDLIPGTNDGTGLKGIDWVITGGESGNNYRASKTDWFRSIRDQVKRAKGDGANPAYFHKQNGGSRKINGAYGGRELDGVVWDERPF